MQHSDLFFRALGLSRRERSKLARFANESGLPLSRLKHYNDTNTVPSGDDLERVLATADLTKNELLLSMGRVDHRMAASLSIAAREVGRVLSANGKCARRSGAAYEVFRTQLGRLYEGDCLDLLPSLENDSVDLVFADPPFNLNKLYPSGIDDNLREQQYVEWCEEWLEECIRILKWGGSLFLWNLPKWNTILSGFLDGRLTFRHWIAVDIKYSLPIEGRLYPSHYSLLYYCKGQRPVVFHPDRLPMEVCPKCKTDLRDYGGYKNKMNPLGVNLPDVWFDIAPVRHSKYKKREGANELPIQLLDRVIQMASDEGDLVFDPFGGSGTTYAVAEIKKRRWIGVEIGETDSIASRLSDIREERARLNALRRNYNSLFTEETMAARKQLGLWTHESFR